VAISVDWLYGSCLIAMKKNSIFTSLGAVRFALFLISLDLGVFFEPSCCGLFFIFILPLLKVLSATRFFISPVLLPPSSVRAGPCRSSLCPVS
jgi:hypothetical protein